MFAWEYKGRRAGLDAAFNQLRQYALALENPPLLIVSDMTRLRIRTNWTNSVSVTDEFTLEDLVDGATTQGCGRYDRHTKRAQQKKDIWLRPFRKDWRRTLNR